MAQTALDREFTELPLEGLAGAALEAAKQAGAQVADFRLERHQNQQIRVKDTSLEALSNSESIGYSVRVVVDGSWGFAASVALTPEQATETARDAVAVAKALASVNSESVELAPVDPATDTFISSYDIDPFDLDDSTKVGFLISVNEKVLRSGKVDHVDFGVSMAKENKFLATLGGSAITQQRVRIYGNFSALKVDPETGAFETMRSNSMPSGRGWEYIGEIYDFHEEAERIPELLEEKITAPSVEPGSYDLVIHPTNLWLTVHESIGHATELDRALGYEAAYAGTSFATKDRLGELQYGSPVMNVTGDRVTAHGLSTVGYDDEGVPATTWDIISDGVLVGYQLNRHMALKEGFGESNGCAYADSYHHVPLQRMPNVSLQPAASDIQLEELIGGVSDGIYVIGDKSWSIDMQRYNFQFTGQQFHRIKDGKLAGQLKDVAYQATTTDFWNAMEAVGGPSTYVLGGAFNCGKGQPGQIAPVSHGAPVALFRQINILNTAKEKQ